MRQHRYALAAGTAGAVASPASRTCTGILKYVTSAPRIVIAHTHYAAARGRPAVYDDQVEHAAAVRAPGPASPWFHEGQLNRWTALCGVRVEALLPTSFDQNRGRACNDCTRKVDEYFETGEVLPPYIVP